MSTPNLDALERLLTPKPQQVEVVRPRASGAEHVGRLIGSVSGFFLTAWLIMVLAPAAVGGLTPGYWQVVATMLVVRGVLGPRGSSYLYWTKRGEKRA